MRISDRTPLAHRSSCKYGTNLANAYIAAAQTMGGYDWGLTDQARRGCDSGCAGGAHAQSNRRRVCGAQCGRCYEVKCVDGIERGTPTSKLGPWKGCLDAGRRSVVVKITDSCPCFHPNTGNRRWCCGDALHLDLSYLAFEAIAQKEMGVVDLQIRAADCSRWGQLTSY